MAGLLFLNSSQTGKYFVSASLQTNIGVEDNEVEELYNWRIS
jgi:hypothetical protein